jgi:VWFA-related protein
MRTGFATVACLLLWCGAAFAQSAPRDPNTFRTDVEAVEVDVRVVDAAGHPVRGLTRDDFELFEDGVRQDVRTFTPVDVPNAPLARTITLEPDVQTNRRPFDGRIYVLVLDDLHTHPLHSSRVKRAAQRFLDEYMASNDRVAIVTTSGRTDASQELTSSRSALLAALERFQGRKVRSSTLERIDQYYMNRDVLERRNDGRPERIDDPLIHERGYQARLALDTLANVARWLGTVPARRKALLFVSEGIDYDIHDVFENKEASTIVSSTRDAITAATRGNVTIYGIDPRGLTLGDDGIEVASLPEDTTLNLGTTSMQREVQLSQDSLRTLADETGGFALVNANDLSGGFERIVKENTHYYLLGYQPSNTRRDGRFRKLEVRVKRPGARVLARRGYVAAKDAPTRKAEASEESAPDLRPLLDSAVPVHGLALDSSIATFRGTNGKTSALVTLEMLPDLAFKEADGLHRARVDVSVMAISADGKVTGGGQRALELKLRPETRDHVQRHGIRTLSRLELAPGRYQVRIAAREQGRDMGGSVIHDLHVPDYGVTPIALSHVVLASRGAAQAMTTKPDAELKDKLPLPPTTSRAFDTQDTLTVFAEVYDNRPKSTNPVELVTTVSDLSGKVLFRTQETVQSFSFEPSRKSWAHRVDVPLKDLAPGAYVARIEAKPSDGSSSTVHREVPFSVRSSVQTTM